MDKIPLPLPPPPNPITFFFTHHLPPFLSLSPEGVVLASTAADNAAAAAAPVSTRAEGLELGYMKGVNVGGWLILENWMFPGFMGGWLGYPDDEWGVVGARGGPESQEAIDFMTNHWDTFITEADVDEMQAFGFTHVRIPVGHFSLLTLHCTHISIPPAHTPFCHTIQLTPPSLLQVLDF
jgi:hypothetical protein